jgi:hypothetical protein
MIAWLRLRLRRAACAALTRHQTVHYATLPARHVFACRCGIHVHAIPLEE